jgi:hypothetical protein
MAKILLIEPEQILRQAISLALFPEHDVRVEENLTTARLGSLEGYELLIVDGAALRENEHPDKDLTRAVLDCKTPTLWLDDSGATQAPKKEKLLVMNTPIERELFRSAINDLLSGDAPPAKAATISSPAPAVKNQQARRETTDETAGPAEQGSFGFIDLVEVAEEKGSSQQEKRTTKKSK